MDDLKLHKIRKNGEFTPHDIIKQAEQVIAKHPVKRMVTIIEDEDGTVHRFNTGMDVIEMAGLLEFAKLSEICE